MLFWDDPDDHWIFQTWFINILYSEERFVQSWCLARWVSHFRSLFRENPSEKFFMCICLYITRPNSFFTRVSDGFRVARVNNQFWPCIIPDKTVTNGCNDPVLKAGIFSKMAHESWEQKWFCNYSFWPLGGAVFRVWSGVFGINW